MIHENLCPRDLKRFFIIETPLLSKNLFEIPYILDAIVKSQKLNLSCFLNSIECCNLTLTPSNITISDGSVCINGKDEKGDIKSIPLHSINDYQVTCS